VRVVIDTNLLLRMAAAADRSSLLRAWTTKRFTVLTSEALLAELKDVVTRPELERFLPAPRAELLLSLIASRAVFVKPVEEHPHCRDPKDDMFIATAIAGRANFLVTADKDLYDDATLVSQLYSMGIRVVQRDEFLSAL
jgi:uncharacterized protein